jgi:hypothetical protein
MIARQGGLLAPREPSHARGFGKPSLARRPLTNRQRLVELQQLSAVDWRDQPLKTAALARATTPCDDRAKTVLITALVAVIATTLSLSGLLFAPQGEPRSRSQFLLNHVVIVIVSTFQWLTHCAG